MRATDPAAQALRLDRSGLAERTLVWIAARNRLTDGIEALGLWSGEDSETITVTDMWTGTPASRVFHGAGSTLGVSSVQHEAGPRARPHAGSSRSRESSRRHGRRGMPVPRSTCR